MKSRNIGLRSSMSCACQPDIRFVGATTICTRCMAVPAVDDVGIVRLNPSDVHWSDVDASVVSATRAAHSADELVNSMLTPGREWPATVQRALLHPATGAPATLVTPGAGAVLDLGTGWQALAGALDSFGLDVVRGDWVSVRLRFGVLMHEPAGPVAVHLDPAAPLPWATGTFRNLFLDLDEVDRVSSQQQDDPVAVRRQILEEAARVLDRSGTAVIKMRGTWRLETAPRALRPRRLFEIVRSVAGRSDAHTLRRAGLVPRRMFVPWPDAQNWRHIVPRERLREHLLARLRRSGPRGMLARTLLAVGGARVFVKEYYCLAQSMPPRREAPAPRTVAEELIDPGSRPPVVSSLSDARVAAMGVHDFVKIPLSVDQQRALAVEVQNTKMALGTSFRSHVVPGGGLSAVHGQFPYARYPAIAARPVDPAVLSTVIVDALRGIDTSRSAPLGTTTFWSRMLSARGSSDIHEAGARTLAKAVQQLCSSVSVPVGPVHGDLHPSNVLLAERGNPLLVDWNRFEASNPLLLDAVYAAVSLHQVRTGESLARAVELFVDGALEGEIATHARSVLGELSPLQAATVMLVDRVVSYSLPRRRYKPWTRAPLQAAVEALAARLQ